MTFQQPRPHFQQAVYDEGYRDGRRDGFDAGEEYGRGIQKMHDELKPMIGFALGILASTLAVIAMKTIGVMP